MEAWRHGGIEAWSMWYGTWDMEYGVYNGQESNISNTKNTSNATSFQHTACTKSGEPKWFLIWWIIGCCVYMASFYHMSVSVALCLLCRSFRLINELAAYQDP